MTLSWKRIKVLIINTFMKEYRNKGLIFLLVFTIAIIFLDNYAMNFFSGIPGKFFDSDFGPLYELDKIKMKLFWIIITSWSGLMGTILGVNAVKSDLRLQVLPQILAWPIRRSEYLLGRVIGTWLIVLAYYLLSIGLGMIIFSISSPAPLAAGAAAGIPSADVAIQSWSVLSLFFSTIILSLAVLVVISLSIILSLYLSKIWAFLLVIVFSGLVGVSNRWLGDFNIGDGFSGLRSLGISDFWDYLKLLIHYFFPRLGYLGNLAMDVFYQRPLQYGEVFLQGMHFLFAYGLLWALLWFVFRRREF